jgi:hypothetical protein
MMIDLLHQNLINLFPSHDPSTQEFHQYLLG